LALESQSAVIVHQKWLKDSLQSAELKLPPLWTARIAPEHFLDRPEVLQQLESLITGPAESESSMESIWLDLP
jgi:hypothetical protein